MKKLLCFLLITCATAVVYADIQDPPANDQGPTRKLGRGFANVVYGSTEFFNQLCVVNNLEGNAASGSYGIAKGLGRTFVRFGTGVFEMVTFPFPTTNGTYRSPLKSNIPWIHGGYSEFPPELGWETKFNYSRSSPAN